MHILPVSELRPISLAPAPSTADASPRDRPTALPRASRRHAVRLVNVLRVPVPSYHQIYHHRLYSHSPLSWARPMLFPDRKCEPTSASPTRPNLCLSPHALRPRPATAPKSQAARMAHGVGAGESPVPARPSEETADHQGDVAEVRACQGYAESERGTAVRSAAGLDRER